MDLVFEKLKYAVTHLEILHEVFQNSANFSGQEEFDRDIYIENTNKFNNLVNELGLEKQLYGQHGRQMILADLVEYIYLGRGYYSMRTKQDKGRFIKLILYLTNILMSYETITASDNLRAKVLRKLASQIPQISKEERFNELLKHAGTVGLPRNESDASKQLDKYFDSILPKTAGGLWHELLVFIFLLRNNIGYIIPLLLTQRLIGLERNIIPPDFLIITHSKQLFGVEVGTKKEIQSGSFSLQTSIPTATINTINSRASDRCPICHRWLQFCDYVIDKYSDFSFKIPKIEVKCLKECDIYSEEEKAKGACPHTKYKRNRAPTLPHTQHDYADGKYHYHYRCVLEKVGKAMRDKIINVRDNTSIKTHYPFYSGLEELIQKET
ncbi:hypothetical protein ES703_81009 [subsurface metagenome]